MSTRVIPCTACHGGQIAPSYDSYSPYRCDACQDTRVERLLELGPGPGKAFLQLIYIGFAVFITMNFLQNVSERKKNRMAEAFPFAMSTTLPEAMRSTRQNAR